MTPIPTLLAAMRDSATHLAAMAKKMDAPFSLETTEPRALHNQYVRSLAVAYSSKFSQLLVSLLGAIDDKRFLAYALAGRALIETTATLRYYVVSEYKPLFDKGSLTTSEMRRLIEIDDRHLRGGRFDWESFLLHRYDKLQEDAVAKLATSKSRQKHVVQGAIAEQINVFTCVEKWAKTVPTVLIAYNLFCDLVHPNIGSSFLVASTNETGMHFSPEKGRSVGEAIYEQSVPILVACTVRPFGENLERLLASSWQADEL